MAGAGARAVGLAESVAEGVLRVWQVSNVYPVWSGMLTERERDVRGGWKSAMELYVLKDSDSAGLKLSTLALHQHTFTPRMTTIPNIQNPKPSWSTSLRCDVTLIVIE